MTAPATDVPEVPVLTDGTVTLRALEERDVPGCYEQCVDPLSVEWTTVPVPFTPGDARQFCLEIAPGAWADGSQWILAVEAEGRYAGNIALRPMGSRRAELAYGAHPWARGRGHLEAACRLLLDWGYGQRDLETVLWMADVGNWASRKLAWRLGFAIAEGTAPRWLPHRGEYRDAWFGTRHRDDDGLPRGRWLSPSTLEADGVRLRPFRETDDPRVIEACGDERTAYWLGTMPSPYTQADVLVWRESVSLAAAEGRAVHWAVADPADDRLLGAIDAFDVSEHTCEVGYWTHPDARGRGVMTAATRAVVGWCFDDLGVRRVRACAALENSASRHVLEAVGMTLAGHERLGTTLRTGRADIAVYDVVATEWDADLESVRR